MLVTRCSAKDPFEHGDHGIGMCKAEFAGDDWLSDELQIDPIIDEPVEMTSARCPSRSASRQGKPCNFLFYKTHPDHFALRGCDVMGCSLRD